jgi:hypothetical protein
MLSSLSGSLNIVPLDVSNPHVLQVAGEHIGEYPLHAHNVCETAAGFVADRTRTACCRDGTASEERRYVGQMVDARSAARAARRRGHAATYRR